jgi:hypothetical protein
MSTLITNNQITHDLLPYISLVRRKDKFIITVIYSTKSTLYNTVETSH